MEEYAFALFMKSFLRKLKNKKLSTEEIQYMLDGNWSGEYFYETLKRKKKETCKKLSKNMRRLASQDVVSNKLNKRSKKQIESDKKHSLMVYKNEQTRKRNKGIIVNDEATCSKCASFSGSIFKKAGPLPYPLQPRCRCRLRLVDIIDNWEQTTQSLRDL